ncbi:hypothetical protein [Mycolicibacterium tokaiense]|nr:hypothetical protein [Mycolicibacterium tokaiense]BBY85600.1 hypothetical protein MTOK_13820 [Mycolicibacterium tokaiense]
MFDTLPDPATYGELTPKELVTAIREYHQAEAQMTARKLACIAHLVALRESLSRLLCMSRVG